MADVSDQEMKNLFEWLHKETFPFFVIIRGTFIKPYENEVNETKIKLTKCLRDVP